MFEVVFWIAAAVGPKHSHVELGQEVVLEGITDLTPIQVKCLNRGDQFHLGSVRIELDQITEQSAQKVFHSTRKFSDLSHELHIM